MSFFGLKDEEILLFQNFSHVYREFIQKRIKLKNNKATLVSMKNTLVSQDRYEIIDDNFRDKKTNKQGMDISEMDFHEKENSYSFRGL